MNYLQKALLWALVATAFLLGVFIAEVTRVEATTTDGYCRIGADPVNPGLLLEGEKIYKLPQDLRARIGSKSGKISDCVLKAGEELVISETSTGIWRVVRIYSCGNPVLSEMYAEISQAPTPMPHTNLRPLQAPQQQAPPQQSAPTTLSQTTNVMVQAPSTPTGPPINVSHYENGNGGSYNPNSAYDNYYNNGGQSSGYSNSGDYMPQILGAAIGTFGAAILGNQYSPPPAVIYNDSFNSTVVNNRRGRRDYRDNNYGYGRNDRNYRNNGGNNSYDSYYSSRGQGGNDYRSNRGGTKYCPPTRIASTSGGTARQNYINQTIRGAGNNGGGNTRQSYVNQTTRSGGNGRTRR